MQRLIQSRLLVANQPRLRHAAPSIGMCRRLRRGPGPVTQRPGLSNAPRLLGLTNFACFSYFKIFHFSLRRTPRAGRVIDQPLQTVPWPLVEPGLRLPSACHAFIVQERPKVAATLD